MKPRARFRPLAAHRDRRHLEHVRNFVQREAAEESHLDDLRLPWVVLGQLTQRLIYREQLAGGFDRHAVGFAEINNPDLPSSVIFRAST